MRAFFATTLLLLCAIALVSSCPAATRVSPVNVTLQTPDGVTLAGTWWGQKDQAPSVLLLHMLGRNRTDWNALGAELSSTGLSVLAIDFRGHGESLKQAARTLDFEDFSDKDWRALVTDATAALDWLAVRPGVDPARVGIVGASIGANAALLAAGTAKQVKTVVLLSPGIEYHGLKTERAMEQLGTRSAFLVASEEDEASARAVKRLASLARGRTASKIFSKAGHGTHMFEAQPTLRVQLAGWLRENL